MKKIAVFVCLAGWISIPFLKEIPVQASPEGAVVMQQQGDLDDLKGKLMVVLFTVKNEQVEKGAIDLIKKLVGNPLKASRATTINGRTTLQVTPVNEPKAFVERLAEIGKITKIEGANVYFQVNTAAITATLSDTQKDAGKGIVLKSDKGKADYAGAITMTDPHYKANRAKLFLFEMEEGKTYQIDMKSAKFICILTVEDLKLKTVAKNGPNIPKKDATLTVTPTATGKYRIIASAFGIGGDFTLTVQQMDAAKK
jgi:hypothetical protein